MTCDKPVPIDTCTQKRILSIQNVFREEGGPVRIQRTRRRGFRLPPRTVCVSRPCLLGNPFIGEPEAVSMAFLDWVVEGTVPVAAPDKPVKRLAFSPCDARRARIRSALPSLVGLNVACWCSLDQPCHGDVILCLANGKEIAR